MQTTGKNNTPKKENRENKTGKKENAGHEHEDHPDTEAEKNEDYESGPDSKGIRHNRDKTKTGDTAERTKQPGSPERDNETGKKQKPEKK